MNKSTVRVLVVDDYAPWRHFVSTTLAKEPGLEVIGEASDGLEAIQEAKELQPDLILLDISLPTLNGLEAAPRIRRASPNAKIIFLTQERDNDIRTAAVAAGAEGYVLKSNAAAELVPAIHAALANTQPIPPTLTPSLVIG